MEALGKLRVNLANESGDSETLSCGKVFHKFICLDANVLVMFAI